MYGYWSSFFFFLHIRIRNSVKEMKSKTKEWKIANLRWQFNCHLFSQRNGEEEHGTNQFTKKENLLKKKLREFFPKINQVWNFLWRFWQDWIKDNVYLIWSERNLVQYNPDICTVNRCIFPDIWVISLMTNFLLSKKPSIDEFYQKSEFGYMRHPIFDPF